MPEKTKQETLSYKNRLLRRKDNLLYYGSMSDKYIIMLQVASADKVDDLSVANKVSVQLELTDPSVKGRERIQKKTEKANLYAALDVASVWLDRALTSEGVQ